MPAPVPFVSVVWLEVYPAAGERSWLKDFVGPTLRFELMEGLVTPLAETDSGVGAVAPESGLQGHQDQQY